MKLIDFIQATNPDLLEKVAGIKEDALIDLLEKHAEYTVNLLFEKLAEGEQEEVKKEEVKKEQEIPLNPDGSPMVPVTEQLTGGQTNAAMDDNRPSNSIKVNDIQTAVQEALAAGAGDKIIAFVNALAQQNPEAIGEIVKIIKVELHSAYMNKQIDEESAIKISDALNAMLDGGNANE